MPALISHTLMDKLRILRKEIHNSMYLFNFPYCFINITTPKISRSRL